MTILGTTEDGTEDTGRSADMDAGVIDIGPLVEASTLVTLTAAEEVAGDRTHVGNGVCARHTDGATRHVDGTLAARSNCCRLAIAIHRILTHVGHLVSSIDVGQDMSARYVYLSVAIDSTGILKPPARLVGIVARATAEHVAEECVAVVANSAAAFGAVSIGIFVQVTCCIGIFIIRCILVVSCFLSIRPAGTLGKGGSVIRVTNQSL